MEASAEGRLRALLESFAVAPAAPSDDAVVATARAAVAQAAGKDQAALAAAPARRFGRNDMVTVARGDERQTLKWKKAEAMLAEGWKLVDEA
jgi:hypothetical protein